MRRSATQGNSRNGLYSSSYHASTTLNAHGKDAILSVGGCIARAHVALNLTMRRRCLLLFRRNVSSFPGCYLKRGRNLIVDVSLSRTALTMHHEPSVAVKTVREQRVPFMRFNCRKPNARRRKESYRRTMRTREYHSARTFKRGQVVQW